MRSLYHFEHMVLCKVWYSLSWQYHHKHLDFVKICKYGVSKHWRIDLGNLMW